MLHRPVYLVMGWKLAEKSETKAAHHPKMRNVSCKCQKCKQLFFSKKNIFLPSWFVVKLFLGMTLENICIDILGLHRTTEKPHRWMRFFLFLWLREDCWYPQSWPLAQTKQQNPVKGKNSFAFKYYMYLINQVVGQREIASPCYLQ